jgi:hypothetical protein
VSLPQIAGMAESPAIADADARRPGRARSQEAWNFLRRPVAGATPALLLHAHNDEAHPPPISAPFHQPGKNESSVTSKKIDQSETRATFAQNPHTCRRWKESTGWPMTP